MSSVGKCSLAASLKSPLLMPMATHASMPLLEVAQNRGLGGLRTLMGLVSLVDRHSFPAVNRACERAVAKGTWRLRDVRALLEAKEIQTQITFEEHHPLIRNLREYGLFIQKQTQDS